MSACDAAVEREPSPIAIRIVRLGVAYGAREVLRDVTLDVERRRITALVGPSGAGKSTLLACLNRMTDLVPSCRVRGEIRLDDVVVSSATTDVVALRRRVGMIFQEPNPFPMSVRRNLELVLREHRFGDRAAIAARVERVLDDVGLLDEVADRLDRPATELSGGQQQRLCLARALALEPEVLLLDEPCSALDPLATTAIEELLQRLASRITVIIVTHNLAQARRLADSMAVLWPENGIGRLVEHGPTERVFTRARDPRAAAYVDGMRG